MKKIHKILIYCLCAILIVGTGLTIGLTRKKRDYNTINISEVTHSIFYAPFYTAINNGYFEVPGTFYMQEGKLRVNLRMLNRQGNAWLTDALNYIAVRGLQFRCDSMEQY